MTYSFIDDEPEFAGPVEVHRYSLDTDRCVCGGMVVDFTDGDRDGELGEGCEAADRVWEKSCGLCGESLAGERAEMYDPKRPLDASRIVHAECGLQRGWQIA